MALQLALEAIAYRARERAQEVCGS
jgi:hypothetical protein